MLEWLESGMQKVDPLPVAPELGRWTIRNSLALVLRGYARWQETGIRPTKQEIEAIDPEWERDLNTVAKVQEWLDTLNKQPSDVM